MMRTISPLRSERGFSFLSMIFLMLVLSSAVTIGYMATTPNVQENRMEISMQRMELIEAGIERYRDHNGAIPPTLDALVTSTGTACAPNVSTRKLTGWCGPYMDIAVAPTPDAFKTDAWGTTIQLSGGILRSCGPNRTCGDSDDITLTL